MGAGITIAQGLHRVEPDAVNFAFVGDSTFFASGLTGVVNAVYNDADIVLIVLDNSTTAMTGHQPHPGTGKTMMGEFTQKVSIPQDAGGCRCIFYPPRKSPGFGVCHTGGAGGSVGSRCFGR